jgi:MFS transporter, ACS family, aldohexuronate transporter
LSRRAAWTLALIATFTMAVSYFDRQTLAALAPSVRKALDIDQGQYGILVSMFSVAYLVGAPPAGWLVDRLGARRGLVGAVLAWSVVAALHALVPGFGVLLGLRIALGLTEAPSFPGAAQTVQRVLPPAERARGFGVLFTGSSLGAMLAPPVAAYVAGRWNWRIAFLTTAVLGLVWVPIWMRFAYAERARAVLDVRPPSASDEPAPSPWSLLQHRAVLRAVVAVIASAPAIGFVVNFGADYLVTDLHKQQADVGHYLWLPPLVFDAGAVAFGHLASRRAARRGDGSSPLALFAVAALLESALVLMPFASSPWPAVLVAGVSMAGGGGVYAIVTADMLSRVPQRLVSSAGGITAAAQSIALIVASPLAGRSAKLSGSYTIAMIAIGAWVVPGALAWVAWRPPAPAPEPSHV